MKIIITVECTDAAEAGKIITNLQNYPFSVKTEELTTPEGILARPEEPAKRKTPEAQQKIEEPELYKGWFHIRCDECREVKEFISKDMISSCTCDKCGKEIMFKNLKPMFTKCKNCGSEHKYLTNRNEAAVRTECCDCGKIITCEMNSRRTAYTPERIGGGQIRKTGNVRRW